MDLDAPRWRGQPGRLEVWYTTLTDPLTGAGFWLHTGRVAPTDGSLLQWGTRTWRVEGHRPRGDRRASVKRLLVAVLLVSACSGRAPVQADDYVARVNNLCDALLLKIEPYSHPGTYSIATYNAELAGHDALRRSFDTDLAKVPVPETAKEKHKALQDYVDLANEIDRRRDVASKQSQAAFDKEITTVLRGFATDPVHLALIGAGFSESCTAR